MEVVWDILIDGVLDTLKLLPFLFLAYLLMEWLEQKAGEKSLGWLKKPGAGPLVGGVLGAVPQCGFSAASANLYAGRVITLGTLFAVFLSAFRQLCEEEHIICHPFQAQIRDGEGRLCYHTLPMTLKKPKKEQIEALGFPYQIEF